MAEAAFAERLGKSALVTDAAARNVDDRDLRDERVNHGGGDEMASFRPALAGDHQVVTAPRQLDGIGNVFVWRFRFAARPTIDHVHAQRGATVRDSAADASEPEHAQGFAADAAT